MALNIATTFPVRKQSRWTWLATVALTVAGLLAAAGLVAPGCYAYGRMWLPSNPSLVPAAYSGAAAPIHVAVFVLSFMWFVLFVRHAVRTVRAPYGWLHVGAPLVVALYCAWQTAVLGYACNPM
jgi:hypothetical protein